MFVGKYMELTIIVLSEISETHKDRYQMFSPTWRIQKKIEKDILEAVLLGMWKRKGEGEMDKKGMNMIKLCYIH